MKQWLYTYLLINLIPLVSTLITRYIVSYFHTTQEVSSWSTIVCIPVSPVAIYPVFKRDFIITGVENNHNDIAHFIYCFIDSCIGCFTCIVV